MPFFRHCLRRGEPRAVSVGLQAPAGSTALKFLELDFGGTGVTYELVLSIPNCFAAPQRIFILAGPACTCGVSSQDDDRRLVLQTAIGRR
jgi:hypothetical protein